MKIALKLTTIALTLVMLASCGGYEKLMKGTDFDAKYAAAMKYYEDNQYTKAIQLFENLIMHYHGKENAENIAWYYSQCLLAEKDYYSAGYQFNNFFKRFPYSDRAEEALYMAAECKYSESPEYYHDQRLTKEAITAYEAFVDRYPNNVHIPEINSHLDELRAKLMRKDYENAYGYYVTQNYNAAYHSLQTFINNYPDSPMKEDAMFYQLASSYYYSANSQENKVKERMQQVVNDFDKFATAFNSSKYMPKAQEFYTKAKAAIAERENITK